MADKKISELPEHGRNIGPEDMLLLVTEGEIYGNVRLRLKNLYNRVTSWLALDDGVDVVNAEENNTVGILSNISHLIGGTSEIQITLPEAVGHGQLKILVMTSHSGNDVIVTGSFNNFSTLRFTAAGQSATLLYTANKWNILSHYNVSVG